MLSSFDDYFVHQTSRPVAVPATTDRNAYDRFWFNGYTNDGSLYLGIGSARYPNLGIQDCGLTIVHDGVQLRPRSADDQHLGAGRGQSSGAGPPDATTPAGDQCPSSLEAERRGIQYLCTVRDCPKA